MACGVGAEHFHVLDGHDVDNSKPSVHYTILFNAFVLMTLCNEVNCRKLEGEFNVFAGVCSNAWFVGVLLGTLVLQVLVQEREPRHSMVLLPYLLHTSRHTLPAGACCPIRWPRAPLRGGRAHHAPVALLRRCRPLLAGVAAGAELLLASFAPSGRAAQAD